MASMKVITAVLLIVAVSLIHTKAARRKKFGHNKWDSSYTLKVEMHEVSYDGEGSASKTYIYKRDESLGKYQEWSEKRGMIAIEQKDASGQLWRVSFPHQD